ncbi:MAG: glycosyltransferase family 4 protein [Hylemonella sp.]
MRIVLTGDVFPPLRSSGAVLLRDLSLEMARQGHQLTVLVPAPELDQPWRLEALEGVEVLRLKAPRTKDVGLVRRALAELWMPVAMWHNLRRSPLRSRQWDGVVWYSPTIFLGLLASALKRRCGCRSYLVLRDIFPEWAVDMGLMRRGLPYLFFKAVERFQYRVADVIGVQAHSALGYFDAWARRPGRRVEVLQNWLADAPVRDCSISVASGPLVGRKIFVYAGNMGVAQGMDLLLDLAEVLRHRSDMGFLFVGRGSEAVRLRDVAAQRELDNVQFHDEIDPVEIPALYAQCHVGLVALDPRHRTHNIPGKFLSYMWGGLPALASINRGNDLADVIREAGVGRVCEDHRVASLQQGAEDLLKMIEADGAGIRMRCRQLAADLFSPEAAVRQIVAGLQA